MINITSNGIKQAIDDLLNENDKLQEEIERQKEIIRQLDIKNLELTTIIKEVREYIEYQLENLDFEEDR